MQRGTTRRLLGLAVIVAVALVACRAGTTGGRGLDRTAAEPTSAAIASDSDLGALLLGDDLAPGEAEALDALAQELPAEASPASAPAADSTSAPSATGVPGGSSISTTEATQLLNQIDVVLSQLDGELAAHDDAAITMGE